MKVLLRLFNMQNPAVDGSTIPRSSVEEYLAGEDYKIIIRDRLALGGVTHKDRKVDPRYSDIIAQDDQILVDSNVTHYITKIYVKPGDPICYAEVELLDPDNYSGDRRNNILNLMGDLKSGIKLPCSVVIQALWSYSNVAEKIIRIKGVDFTLGPSFEGSGTEKVFSSIKPETEVDETKVFSSSTGKSLEGCVMRTVAFSNVECYVISEETEPDLVSLNQVAKTYGRISEVYLKAKSYSVNSEDKNSVTRDKLLSIVREVNRVPEKTFSDDDKVNYIKAILLKSLGEDNIKQVDDVISNNRNSLIYIFDSVPGAGGPSAEQLVSQKLDKLLRNNPDTYTFSTINSVRDRMFFNRYPRYSLINRLVKSYKSYYESNSEMSESDLNWLKILFIQDLSILIRNVIPNIVKGSTLNSLYALIQFNDDISKAGMELTTVYRQVILSEKVLGFVPESKYKQWKDALYKFFNEFSKYSFGKELDIQLTSMDALTKL